MIIKFTSGNDYKVIDTHNFNDFCDISDAVFNALHEVWNPSNRKAHNTLIVSDGTTTVHIGPNANGTGRHFEWFNCDEKVGGIVCYGQKMCAGVWNALWLFLYRFFGIPMDNYELEGENMAALCDFENNAMNELGSVVENTNATIKNAEVSIKEHFDIDHIFELSEQVYNSIVNAKAAANNFINKMSDFTGCGFTMADAYAETPAINTTCLIADIDTDMDVEDIFREWLGKIFGDNYYTIESLYNSIAA